jgi:hypothetical protein
VQAVTAPSPVRTVCLAGSSYSAQPDSAAVSRARSKEFWPNGLVLNIKRRRAATVVVTG